jgi:hypothetical protein
MKSKVEVKIGELERKRRKKKDSILYTTFAISSKLPVKY